MVVQRRLGWCGSLSGYLKKFEVIEERKNRRMGTMVLRRIEASCRFLPVIQPLWEQYNNGVDSKGGRAHGSADTAKVRIPDVGQLHKQQAVAFMGE